MDRENGYLQVFRRRHDGSNGAIKIASAVLSGSPRARPVGTHIPFALTYIEPLGLLGPTIDLGVRVYLKADDFRNSSR